MAKTITKKRGRDLKIGDQILRQFGESRTITGFEKHPGLRFDRARVVVCQIDENESYKITCFNHELYRLTSDKIWVLAHIWFQYEQKLKAK